MAVAVYGFPILGALSQGYVYPFSSKFLPRHRDPKELFPTVESRPRQRPRTTPKHDEAMWAESSEQVNKGRLRGPLVFNDSGKLIDNPNLSINLTFRFPVSQIDKARDIEDLKRGLVNEFFVIDSPIVLPSRDHAVEQFLPISHQPRSWDFMIADRDSAYKELPIRPRDSRFCNIALFGPFRKCWCAFGPKTQISGPIASALRYNVFSRILSSVINRISVYRFLDT